MRISFICSHNTLIFNDFILLKCLSASRHIWYYVHRYQGRAAKMTHNAKQKRLRRPSRSEIHRTVASSTAIETGQSVELLEQKLRDSSRRFRHLKLALAPGKSG